MAKYSSPDLDVQVDNSGGTLVNLTAYVKTIGGFAPESETADTTTFGDSWREHQAHLKSGGELTLEGDYDDTATSGPDAILNAIGDTRTVQIGWGGSGTGKPKTSFEAIVKKYERGANIGGLQTFTCTLLVTGAVTEGTF